jgi:hypothetical protein
MTRYKATRCECGMLNLVWEAAPRDQAVR